ncbi:MAG: hypothetical protein ACLVLR_01485 [Turicibacter sanguinis]
MNYLKKVYANWLTLGLTIGMAPKVIELALSNKTLEIDSFVLILLLAAPTAINLGLRRLNYESIKKITRTASARKVN